MSEWKILAVGFLVVWMVVGVYSLRNSCRCFHRHHSQIRFLEELLIYYSLYVTLFSIIHKLNEMLFLFFTIPCFQPPSISGYCVKEEPGRTVVLFIFDLFHHISTQNYKQKIIETKNFDLILPKNEYFTQLY